MWFLFYEPLRAVTAAEACGWWVPGAGGGHGDRLSRGPSSSSERWGSSRGGGGDGPTTP